MNPQRKDSQLAEHLLVLRAQLGDREAYGRLFERYNPRLLYYLRRRLSSGAEAEDVLQDVWITVVKKVASLERPQAFKAWIYRIAHNRAISRLRATGSMVSLTELPKDLEVEASLKDENEAALFAGYDASAIHEGLERLSPAHREVLTLRFVDEFSYEEIAQIVDCTVGTVRSRIHYGKKSLRALLASRSPGASSLATKTETSRRTEEDRHHE